MIQGVRRIETDAGAGINLDRISHRPRLVSFMIMGLYRNEFSCGMRGEERAPVRRFTFQPYLSDDLISNAALVRVMQSPQPRFNFKSNVKASGRTCPTSIGSWHAR